MSTILDALKKSERERTLVRGVGFGDAGRRLPQHTGWRWWLIVGVVAVTVAALVIALLLRSRVSPVVTGESAATSAARNEAKSVKASLPLQDAVIANAPPEPFSPTTGEARLLTGMSPEFQQRVPEMTVNIHVYAAEESQRILYINNHQYSRGDEIPGGVVVEEIVPDGVVLRYQGQRFRLPRPS